MTVVSTVRSSPPMVADELRRQADNFIELQDLAKKISRNYSDRGDQANDDKVYNRDFQDDIADDDDHDPDADDDFRHTA